MESELEKFRRKKNLEEKTQAIKTKFSTTANAWVSSFCAALLPNFNDDDYEDAEEEVNNEHDDKDKDATGQRLTKRKGTRNSQQQQQEQEDEAIANGGVNKKWIMYLVIFFRFLAWLLVYVGFVKIGFGAVYFTVSLLVFIYWNTRKKRRKGEVSAYSVFNKDCQSIDGTLKAEHLEKQMLYRS